MQIKDIKLYILEGPPEKRHFKGGGGTMQKVPPGLSGLFTHSSGFRGEQPALVQYEDESPQPTYTAMIRLVTDGDLDAYMECGNGFYKEELEWQARGLKAAIGPLLIGVDVFDREYIWQKLWAAQRFLNGVSGIDLVDAMLWDLASRYARLPIYKLLGGYRDKIPAYYNIRGDTIDDLVADALKAKAEGFKGGKDHSFRGVKANIEMAKELREAVGDDFLLMHDAVESYTCDEAIRIGRGLEKYNYSWIEEPLQDFDLMGLKKLSDTLDLPVLALEWWRGQPYSASAFVAMGAVDIVRQRGVGVTGQMKQAHLAESFGMDVHGGDPHIILATQNDPVFEASSGITPLPEDARLTCQGIMVVEDGYMYIAHGNEPVEEPDWDQVERKALVVV